MNHIQIKFKKYHAENPHVWDMFEKLTLKATTMMNHYSANAIFEVVRWETAIGGNDQFKMNNNYRAYYVRMFEEKYPQHFGFFRKRKIAD